MKACLIMYNADADKEVFSVLRTSPFVKHYIKWNDVRGTGSGGLQVLGPIEEKAYCVVLVALADQDAEALYSDIQKLRQEMLNKTGLAVLVLGAEKIG
jgi:hypothetical protein